MLGIPTAAPAVDIKKLAEREGFEPPEPCGSTVFKTAVIDHSTISPCQRATKVLKIFGFNKKN